MPYKYLIFLFFALIAQSISADGDIGDFVESYANYYARKETIKYEQGGRISSKQKDFMRSQEAYNLLKKIAKDDPSIRVEKARNRMLGWKAELELLQAGSDCNGLLTDVFRQMIKNMQPLLDKATSDWEAGKPKRWGHDDLEWREYYAYQDIKQVNNKFIGDFKKQKNRVFDQCSKEKGITYVQWKMNHIDRQLKKAEKGIMRLSESQQLNPWLTKAALGEIAHLKVIQQYHKRKENRGLWTNFDPKTSPSFNRLNEILDLAEGKISSDSLSNRFPCPEYYQERQQCY